MENEYIIEGNKLIAEFEGWKEPSLEYKLKWCGVPNEEKLNKLNKEYIPYLVHSEKSEPFFIDSLQYEMSWDWLIPIIDKIRNTPKVIAFEISFSLGVIVKTYYNDKWHFYESNDIIEAPYVAIIDYIKWYNNEQINNNR